MSKSLYEQLRELNQFEKEINAQKNILIEKSLREPENAKDVVYATQLLQERQKGIKSFLLDPLNANNGGDYRTRPLGNVGYETLRNMAHQTEIVSAIITTRKEQVASYSGYSTEPIVPGWCIQKNIQNYFGDDDYEEQLKLSSFEKDEVKKIIQFIENCGVKKQIYHGDRFDTFLRKFVDDSLTLDQACFEIVPSQFCTPYEFFCIDGATIRFASCQIEEEYEKIRGYYPHAVQLYQGSVWTYYYPWELAIGIRNPSTNIHYNGYGVSELEILVKVITYILYSEAYTGKFFSQGSNPKGIFVAESNLSEDRIQEFRQSWTSQVSGLTGAHKIPILSGGKMNWIDMQKSNADMEFSNWLDYLSRLTCAIFKIDPKEIGYNLSFEGSVNYESSIQEKLIYSKEKGLIPLLRFIESQINTYIVFPLTNWKYKFKFTGIDNKEALIENLDLTKVEKGVMSFEEYRRKHGLPSKIEEDDFLLNSTWIQYKQIQMQSQNSNFAEGMMGGMGRMGGNENEDTEYNNNEEVEGKENYSIFKDFTTENPFIRDLENFAIEKGWTH